MSSINDHLAAILEETKEMETDHTTEADEFIAVNDIEMAVHEARKVFERTKKMEEQ